MSQDLNKYPLPFVTRDMLAFEHGTPFELIVEFIADTVDPFEIRGYTREGPFTFLIVPANTNSISELSFRIPDIPVAVSVNYNAASTEVAFAHISLYLGMNTNRITMLTSGAISTVHGVSWPFPQQTSPFQADGQVISFAGVDPAAGAEVAIAIPNNQIWEIIHWSFYSSMLWFRILCRTLCYC